MDWFKTTSSFWAHPKIAALKDRHFRVLVSLWGYSAQHDTAGHVPDFAVRLVAARPSDMAALVDAGLMHRNGNGWVIHDWDDHQRAAVAHHKKKTHDKEQAAARRANAKESHDETT